MGVPSLDGRCSLADVATKIKRPMWRKPLCTGLFCLCLTPDFRLEPDKRLAPHGPLQRQLVVVIDGGLSKAA